MAAAAPKQEMTLQGLLNRAGVKDDLSLTKSIHINPEISPFDNQLEAINRALVQPNMRYGIYDEPGCGKTLPAQAIALYMIALGNKVVGIMPPVLLGQFKASLYATFQGSEDWIRVHALTEGPKKRKEITEGWNRDGWPELLLMSYAMFQKLFRVLSAVGYDYLIADESHALKNPSTTNHKSVLEFLGKEGERGLLSMTGTPIPNTLSDAFGMVNMITPGTYRSQKSFMRIHGSYIRDSEGRKVLVGYKNQDLLHENLYQQAQREVLRLEKPRIQVMPVELAPAHRKLYKQLVEERFLLVGEEMIDAVTAQSLRQKCLRIVTNPHQFTDSKVKNAVLDSLEELLDSIGVAKEKVLIFSNFQESVRTIASHFERWNPALVYGKSKTEAEKDRFLNDESCRIMVAHPKSGGVGLNLQAQCRYVIFAEPVSVPGDFDQALRRVWRRGQSKPVMVYILKAEGTIAPLLTRSMLDKSVDTLEVTRDKGSLMAEVLGEIH